MVRELKVYKEPELREAVDLSLASGRLNRDAVGWSHRPLHDQVMIIGC